MEFGGSYQSHPNLNSQPQETSAVNGKFASSSSGSSASAQAVPPSYANMPTTGPSSKVINGKRTSEELETMMHTVSRLSMRLAHDQTMILHPDVDSPFADEVDVVNRLLPYHLFQQPKNDLEEISTGKGKGKALDLDWSDEMRTTKLALALFARRKAVLDRWQKVKIRSGQRSTPDDQAYYLAQVILDSDRSENAWLGNELRTARTEVERLEREKRANASVARMSHFPSVPQTPMPAMQAQYYRGYPYAYTQAYGAAIPASTISTFSVSPVTPANYAPYQTSAAIPVQLPVASLPALHALGIIPMPAASLPPGGQPQPPAVLRGSTANGTILSLEINVSLLQSAQMSGLAVVLNSLVARTNAVASDTTTTPQGTANTESSAPSTS